MFIKGWTHKFGDNINTDDIIAAKYLDSQNLEFLGSKCMENIDPDFSRRVRKGNIIVAGENFGCGSSREHAPWAIRGCGVSLVIAKSFARIFFRNSINIGLPIVELPQVEKIGNHTLLEVDLLKGLIKDTKEETIYRTKAFTPFLKEIIESGGLINWVKKR
ncbi:MAG: 3-isopropylmalate dehydratase small subunit [Candidatus Omnitrophica bacterium]|nr:3-isopropylmalate dehydratase small subunit [Candidatus Omnitrophota bacterium]MBD3269811.1 3-isopropylmalate dehydratase small subunit [Candidatus Omnitrophota bacterium]